MNNSNTHHWIIYMYTFPNGKRYIGKTNQNLKVRQGKNWNRYKSCTALYRAYLKYGVENIKQEILFENDMNDIYAGRLEALCIALFKTNCCRYTNPEYGYNMTDGGEGASGNKQSEETKQRKSEILKGHAVTDETREKIRQSQIGKTLSDEHRQHISDSLKGENHPMYGNHHTDETKKKISSANTGRKYSDEVNAKKGHRGINNPSARTIEQYDKDGVFIKKWDYAKCAAETLHIDLSGIIACCRGRNGRKTAGGFIWKYALIETGGELLCVS